MDSHNDIRPILLSAIEAARLLRIGKSLFYSLRSEGRLPQPIKLGTRVLWSKEIIEQWIRDGCPDPNK